MAVGDRDLDSVHGIVLREWSAQDFANIYVRFRPSLIRHAGKFLTDVTQAEEVVQDAFLYLMTALPELDSELGVLRFLKWKTKMLCIDVIRSSTAGVGSNLVPLGEDIADETQPTDLLERADDAAIIHLALSKLNPRHREALIATTYEEKSYEEVAHQMGVSENAFRQLLFRARSSFRRALVGEAEIEGKSVEEILTVAARKVARDSGKVISVTGGFLVLIGLLLSPWEDTPTPVAQDSAVLADFLLVPPPLEDAHTENAQPVEESFPSRHLQVAQDSEPDPELVLLKEDSDVQIETPPIIAEATAPVDSKLPQEGEEGRALLASALDDNLATMLSKGLVVTGLTSSHGLTVIEAENGLTVFLAFDLETNNIIQYVHISFEVDGKTLTGVPQVSLSQVDRGEHIQVAFAATDLIVGDFEGNFGFASVDNTPFSRSGLLVDLTLQPDGKVIFANLGFVPRA